MRKTQQEKMTDELKAPEAGQADPKKAAPRKKQPAKVLPRKSEEVYLQFGGREWKTSDLVQQVRSAYVAEGHRASGIRKLSVYVKPDEGKAYYVVNNKASGSVDL